MIDGRELWVQTSRVETLVDMFAIRYARGTIVRCERILGTALRVIIENREAMDDHIVYGNGLVGFLCLFTTGGQSRDLESNDVTSRPISRLSAPFSCA